MLRTPAPPPGGVAMRGRKRMLSSDATSETTKQPKLRADGDVGLAPGTSTTRALQDKQQPASVLDVANDITSEVNFHYRQRSTSSLTELQPPTITPDREKYVPDIEMVVWIPNGYHSTWKTMTALPHHLSTDLQNKLDCDYNDTRKHTTNYRNMFRFQDRNVETGLCANYFVIHKTRRKVTWDEANGNSNRACDHCIRSRRLCARLVNINSTIKFAIFPLPERFRINKAWNDAEYWVQE
ncbi:hypothetical protein BKA63DRAFT_508556 [Paraphoma chrysanthemicola]|nr:hypothetical protein BKA63DRAFT_508556 [Paraphoma chrysanthemicola]